MAAFAAGGGMKSAVTDLAAMRNEAARRKYADMVMDAFDRLTPPNERQAKRIGKPSLLDTNPDVRRAAKARL